MIFCNLTGCTSGRHFTISWPAGQKSNFSDNFFVYKGVFKFFKQLNDNVKVKMFSDDSSHSEFYYLDQLNFLENEPVLASTSHNNFKHVNNSGEITSGIKKINKLFTV